MAMSDTGSSFAQWADELYNHHDPTDSPDIFPAAAATTTVASPPTSGGSGESPTKAAAASAAHQHLGVDGGARVGKAPARRRSRASRRAPVTLLNTDTANFRAMVQQFTGIPTPPAASAFGGGPVINFAGDYGGFPQASSGVMSSFDHLHRTHPHQPPPAPATLQDQLRRQQQYTGGMFGGYNGGAGAGGDLFASHGFSSAEDRLLMQSIQQAAHHMPPASASNGFFA